MHYQGQDDSAYVISHASEVLPLRSSCSANSELPAGRLSYAFTGLRLWRLNAICPTALGTHLQNTSGLKSEVGL